MVDSPLTHPARILLVDDDRAFRRSTSALLRADGHLVLEASSAEEAAGSLQGGGFDLVLLDVRMPGMDGIQLLEVIRRWGEGVPVLMISGFGTVETAVEALHTGADDFLTKPVEPDVLTGKVADLLERRPSLRGGSEAGSSRMIGRSPAMREVRKAIRRVAGLDTTVLILGETGTGKELAAREIHDASPRRTRPFVPLNCAALAEGVLESELFGHAKGAFTGAVRERPGLFQAADGGTLFLDEIGDISPALQQRLLRVLQEREVTPVGEVRSRKVDVRVLAATHRDLKEEVAKGRFREDLYYRLNVFRLEIPPLRERPSDIPLLVEHFIGGWAPPGSPASMKEEREEADRARVGEWTVSPFAMRLLQAYTWPGNVRELFSALESALIHAGGRRRIEAQHLPGEVRAAGPAARSPASAREGHRYSPPPSRRDEREAILAALREAKGNRSRAASLLGMGRTTLWRKMKEYGITSGESDR